MIRINHPVSGEEGFFCTKLEKEFIDAVISDYKASNTDTNCSSDGVMNG